MYSKVMNKCIWKKIKRGRKKGERENKEVTTIYRQRKESGLWPVTSVSIVPPPSTPKSWDDKQKPVTPTHIPPNSTLEVSKRVNNREKKRRGQKQKPGPKNKKRRLRKKKKQTREAEEEKETRTKRNQKPNTRWCSVNKLWTGQWDKG